jgi:sulfur-carrier protein
MVRYFAAARAAAGIDAEALTVPAGTTIAALAGRLAARNAGLAHLMPRCSYLCDNVAVRNAHLALRPGQTIDVLPPFAGG